MTLTHDFRHIRREQAGIYAGQVASEENDKGLDRLALGAGIAAWAGVAIPSWMARDEVPMPWLWWSLLVGYLCLFLLLSVVEEGTRGNAVVLVALVTAGVLLSAWNPSGGFSSVLMVLSAVCVAMAAPLPVTLAVVFGQTLLVGVLSAQLGGVPVGFSIVAFIVYIAFQLFGVVMVEIMRRENRQRTAVARLNEELAAGNATLVRLNDQLAERNDQLADAQARLAESSRAAERLRISRDLHDTVGHQLTALAVNLEVASHLTRGTGADEPVNQCRQLAKDLLGDVRAVVSQLRDAPNDLSAALRQATSGVPQPHVVLSVPANLPALDGPRAEAVLRCVQEIVTNAVRHAQANRLTIDVLAEEGELIVRAVDDGVGGVDVAEGNGLLGMRERFASLGGVVTVRTRPGDGFRVVARLPLLDA